MNVENIKKVRDLIAGLPTERFDMAHLFSRDGEDDWDGDPKMMNDCGTAACIAGWTNLLLVPPDEFSIMTDGRVASRLLGLTGMYNADGQELGDALFTPVGFEDGPIAKATTAQAVAVLDRLIETGEVDWDWAMANPADLSVKP